MTDNRISDLVERQQDCRALDRTFYCDAEIYEREIDRILLRSWLYACHVSEIPQVGDFRLLEFATESVIIVRASDGDIYALLNVCRHRGSRVCLEKSGNEKRLTCRYHGWTYGLDGALKAAAHMPGGFDKSVYGLRRLNLRIFQGLMFVNFDQSPGNFDLVDQQLGPRMAPYGLDKTRVAHRKSYSIRANWKLAVENYKECYHCAPAHPEYSRSHSLAMADEVWAEEYQQLLIRGVACGLTDDEFDCSYDKSGEFGTDRAYQRYPLLRRFVTGSEDGKQLAPLLGSITGFDRGASDFKIGPLLYGLAYCDHIVLYRFLPVSPDECECDITWLVHEDAVAGEHYDFDRLIWLWDVTTIADKSIIEHNHQGVMSRFYEPGPLSTMEKSTNSWNRWYLKAIAGSSDL